jgi:uncharacterized protein (DUF2336 family)
MSSAPENARECREPASDSPQRPNPLLALAADRNPAARGALFRSVTQVLLASGAPLSERERTEAGLILEALLREVEASLRAALAQGLARRNDVPRSLVMALAADEIMVAEPILAGSPLLGDDELIELIRTRSQEHRLVIAARPGIAERVADALVQTGEELVIERLIRNPDAHLSQNAIEYLVAESQRVDRFREPLLRRADLPAHLAARMYRWVSEALRREILARYPIDPSTLDQAIVAATPAAPGAESEGEAALRLAHQLALRARTRGILNERFVLQNLRAGHVAIAAAALGELAGVKPEQARRYLLDPSGEALVLCCRAADIALPAAVSMVAMAAKAHDRAPPHPLGNDDIAAIYDRLSPPQARVALRLWRPGNGGSGSRVA